MEITRDNIVRYLKQRLETDQSVFALWLEGADAASRVDAYSDIDVWIDVADGEEGRIIGVVETVLSDLASIDFKYEQEHSHPQIRQIFFHLAGTSEFLIIDVCIQSHNRVFWYEKGHPDHFVKILFDRSGVIQYKDPDEVELQRDLVGRKLEIKKTFHFYQAWVKKALRRNDYLEGAYYYEDKVLRPLVELIRLKYQPQKREFYLKHAKRDLPVTVVERLESLLRFTSIDDIDRNLELANKWFDEL